MAQHGSDGACQVVQVPKEADLSGAQEPEPMHPVIARGAIGKDGSNPVRAAVRGSCCYDMREKTEGMSSSRQVSVQAGESVAAVAVAAQPFSASPHALHA